MESKELIEQIRADWEQFKTTDEQRRKEIAKLGDVTAETSTKLDAINAALDANGKALDELETRLNRPFAGVSGGSRPDDKALRVYAAWQSVATGKPVEPDQVDLNHIRNYNRAFSDWARRGDRATADNLRILSEMSVASAPDGGYLVSPDASGMIQNMVYESSPIRQLASVQTISSDALEGMNDLDEANAGWVAETATRSGNTDTPVLGSYRIPAHEMYAEPKVTQKLLDDAAIDVEAWLARKVADKYARTEATAFVTGTGIQKPRGFTTYTSGTPTASAWEVIQQVNSGHATTLTADGLIDLVYSLKAAYLQGAVFGMRRATQAIIRKIQDGDGNYLWQPDYQVMRAPTILGFPIVDMADMAAVAGSALPIVFGNFRAAYQIVDRLGIRTLRDPYTAKGWVKFYSTRRVGGAVVNFEALKLQVVSA